MRTVRRRLLAGRVSRNGGVWWYCRRYISRYLLSSAGDKLYCSGCFQMGRGLFFLFLILNIILNIWFCFQFVESKWRVIWDIIAPMHGCYNLWYRTTHEYDDWLQYWPFWPSNIHRKKDHDSLISYKHLKLISSTCPVAAMLNSLKFC